MLQGELDYGRCQINKPAGQKEHSIVRGSLMESALVP